MPVYPLNVQAALKGDELGLLGAFNWKEHPFGPSFWKIECIRLAEGKPLGRKAAAELRRLLKEAE